MKKIILTMGLATSTIVATSIAYAQDRIVVLGRGTAETVALLGKQSEVVGVGRTSTYPKSLQKNNPIVAYVHRAPAEGILSVNPTHVIGTNNMGPEQTVEVLEKDPNIKLFLAKENDTQSDVVANIRLLGGFLGVYDKADTIAKGVESDFTSVKQATAELPEVKYALVYYWKGKLFASGGGSMATDWAGGVNVFDNVPRRTEVQVEALMANNPDVILVYSSSYGRLEEDGKQFDDLPGIKETNAFKNGKIFPLPGFVYAMGPRTPQAVNYMIGALHGKDKQANLPERAWAPADSFGIE